MFQNSFFKRQKTHFLAVMLSIKLGQLVRTNINYLLQNGKRKYSIQEMLNFLGISGHSVFKQGYSYYISLFDKIFIALHEEGYIIQFDFSTDVNSYHDFLNDYISYRNDKVLTEYAKINHKKSTLSQDK
jgi:hypothetical protein